MGHEDTMLVVMPPDNNKLGEKRKASITDVKTGNKKARVVETALTNISVEAAEQPRRKQ